MRGSLFDPPVHPAVAQLLSVRPYLLMRKIIRVVSIGFVLMPVLFIGGCFYRWWKFDHLEERARRVITAGELQAWATNVLAQVPSYSPSQFYQLHTNYPAKLRSVCPGAGCWIDVPEPHYVMINWTIKPSGDAGFEIGDTNFVSRRPKAHAWLPGVYFYRR